MLLEARRKYRNHQGPLWECVRTSGENLATEYAMRLLRALAKEPHLPAWEQHPARVRADVYRLLDAAIRRSRRLRGGWLVALPSRQRRKPSPTTP